MELSKRHITLLLPATGAVALGGFLYAQDAKAEAAGSISHPQLTDELSAQLTGERPLIAVMDEGNIIIPNAGEWAGASVHESDVVPEAWLNHYQSIRLLLTSTNLLNRMGSLINTVETDQGTAFVPAYSYDFWGITGIDRSIVVDDRNITAHFDDIPPNVLAELGVSAGADRVYHRDVYERTHFRVIEYANVANLISFARGHPLTDDEVKRLVVINASHTGEGTITPDMLYVFRYDSNDTDGTLDLYLGRGNLVWDVLVACESASSCTGANGQQIGHLSTGQYINIGGGRVLRHPQIYRLDHPLNIENPSTGETEEFTDGLFVVPYDVMGAPATHPVTPPPLPPELQQLLIPQCRNGIDDDEDGQIDYPNDSGCTGPDDNNEYSPGQVCVTCPTCPPCPEPDPQPCPEPQQCPTPEPCPDVTPDTTPPDTTPP
ncbi:hypothetical protein KY359_03905, partial [Candidatus Woesearchaeota archaeon]|nr:hypothetical protein [Candidatus Woesearchaeota archaeon]